MTDSVAQQWKKEQRILLDHIQNHPSEDLTEKRDRVAVLTKLIADHAQTA